jgi:hypothetical protein
MITKWLIFLFWFFPFLVFSQERQQSNDGISSKLSIKVDIISRYLWRGQCWGGNYMAVQPTIEYKVFPNLTFGFWATTNFKNDYYYPDGTTSYKGYQEIDLYLSYYFSDFFRLDLYDYYWPSVSKVEGVTNSFFNYGNDGVKTVDASLNFDFTDKDQHYKYPFKATISTLIAGNDYRFDSNGENPKHNFTTYVEIGYVFTFLKKSDLKSIKEIQLSPIVGAVINNQAKYYVSGDYDKVSFINMSLKISKEFELGNAFSLPISLCYTHNGATKNTTTFGDNFLIAGICFKY